MSLLLLPLICFLAADGGSEPLRQSQAVIVIVGQTIEVGVGHARGILCDDLTVVRPTVDTREGRNVVRLEGLRPGKTLCRAGGDLYGPQQTWLEVTVQPAPDGGAPGR